MTDALAWFLVGFNLAALIYGRLLDRAYDRTEWYRERLRFWRELRSRD